LGVLTASTELDEIWQDVMLNQFHDVLPGSSIEMVNVDARAIYTQRIQEAEGLLDAAIAAVLPGSAATNGSRSGMEQQVVILDPARLARNEVIEVSTLLVEAIDVVSQKVTEHSSLALMRSGSKDGIGHLVGNEGFSAPTARKNGDVFELSNADFRLTISEGRITSLIDIHLDRELILPGPGSEDAGLVLYDDFPLAYDAWDVEVYHLDCGEPLKFDTVEIVADGPLRASLLATSTFGKSRAVLTVGVQIHTT
jgi:alpha-mannosidase